jgi:thiol-disulfide isomerase/thioredoxin
MNKDNSNKFLFPALAAAAVFAFVLVKMGANPNKTPGEFDGSIGQMAAPVKVNDWIKTPPVGGQNASDLAVDFTPLKGKVVLLERWATWCGPCISKIPKLIELQKKHPDLAIISLTDESKNIVTTFFEKTTLKSIDKKLPDTKLTDAINYTVGTMTLSDPTVAPYFEKMRGVPSFFIIGRDGKIERAVVGVYDIVLAEVDRLLKGEIRSAEETEKAQKHLANEKERGALRKEIGRLSRAHKENPTPASRKELYKKYARIRELIKEGHDYSGDRGDLLDSLNSNATRAWKYADERQRSAIEKELKQNRKSLYDLLASTNSSAGSWNSIAWDLVAQEHYQLLDSEMGLETSNRALSLAVEKKSRSLPMIKDTVARAHHVNGNLEEALRLEQEALNEATPSRKPSLAPYLDYYKLLEKLKSDPAARLSNISQAIENAPALADTPEGFNVEAAKEELKEISKKRERDKNKRKKLRVRKFKLTRSLFSITEPTLLSFIQAERAYIAYSRTLSDEKRARFQERLHRFHFQARRKGNNNAAFLQGLAHHLTFAEDYQSRNPALALEILNTLRKREGKEDARRIMTRADLAFQQGLIKESIKLLETALPLSQNWEDRSDIEAALRHHKKLKR